MTAPQAVLSAAVFALLIALGIYLGFTWTRSLDTNASIYDSRNVFITYIVGLGVCLGVYSISALIQNEDNDIEYMIVRRNSCNWLSAHPDHAGRWGLGVNGGEGNGGAVPPAEA